MDFHVNRVKKRLADGDVALGIKVDLASPDIVEMVGVAGYDFVWIDCEHGAFYLESAVGMIRAADATNVTPIVRVPNHEPSFIMRVLDAGAMGVLVPNITSAAQARAIVSAAKYKTARTEGTRGACPRVRAAGHQAHDWPAFSEWSNDNTMVWLLVEGVEGIQHLDDILETPGIDAIMLGPFDLSVSMGHGGNTTHPAVVAMLDTIVDTALKHKVDVAAVLLAPTPSAMREEKQRWADRGCRILNVNSDRRILTGMMNSLHQAMRS
jgi:4-hydroxy-2-oxoheptanedioate aldolase